MALDGAAWANRANRFAAYAEGRTPDELTPVLGGAAVPFVSQGVKTELLLEPQGGRDAVVLTAATRTQLPTAGQYTYDGHQWTVLSCDQDRAGGAAWPYMGRLERHAS